MRSRATWRADSSCYASRSACLPTRLAHPSRAAPRKSSSTPARSTWRWQRPAASTSSMRASAHTAVMCALARATIFPSCRSVTCPGRSACSRRHHRRSTSERSTRSRASSRCHRACAIPRERDAAELVQQKADLAATLLASLSHDLRTPLTAIKAAVENLRGELHPEDRNEQARAAATELDRLTRLFQDILDMARIDAAAIRVDRQWVTAADVVDAASAHVRHTLEGRALRMTPTLTRRSTSIRGSHPWRCRTCSRTRHNIHRRRRDTGPGAHRARRPACVSHRSRTGARSRRARTSVRALLSWPLRLVRRRLVRDGSLDHARTAGGGRWTDLGGERARRREVLHRRSRRCPLDRRHTVTSYQQQCLSASSSSTTNPTSSPPCRRCCGHEGMTFFLQ